MTRAAQITGRSVRAAAYRTVTLALVILAVIGALGAVVLSPLVLSRVSSGQHTDWTKLSDVGQTYGAASALLSVLALGGVAFSLYLQRRESKAAREQALRGLHSDLLRMALDDSSFLECYGPIGDSADVSWYRQHIYLNLVVSHWQMMWEIGAISERHLRLTASDLFGGPLGRRYWREARDARRVAEQGRRARIFHSIIDSEFQAAQRHHAADVPDPAVIDRSATGPRSTAARPASLKAGLLFTVAAVAGVAAGQLIGRRRGHRSRQFW